MKRTGNEKKIRKNNLEHKGSSLGLLVSSELEAVKVKISIPSGGCGTRGTTYCLHRLRAI